MSPSSLDRPDAAGRRRAGRSATADATRRVRGAARPSGTLNGVLRMLSFRNISAVYVGLGFIVLFSLWIPDLFWTSTTWKTLVSEQAIVAIVAVGSSSRSRRVPIDLSIGMAVGTGSMVVAWLIGDHGAAIPLAIAASVAAGCLIGLINGVMVTCFNIDSFIATLAMTSVLTAVVTAISGGEQIIGLPQSFSNIASNEIFGIALPVYMMLVVAVVVWYVLEHTPARPLDVRDRRQPGGGPPDRCAHADDPGRLAHHGQRDRRVRRRDRHRAVGRLGAGRRGRVLLPAFAAAFLGSTQHPRPIQRLGHHARGLRAGDRRQRPAARDRVMWLADLFNGVALAVAVD